MVFTRGKYFWSGGIGYYPHPTVFAAVNTWGIYSRKFLFNPTHPDHFAPRMSLMQGKVKEWEGKSLQVTILVSCLSRKYFLFQFSLFLSSRTQKDSKKCNWWRNFQGFKRKERIISREFSTVLNQFVMKKKRGSLCKRGELKKIPCWMQCNYSW